jgi:hypothetical protein
MCYSDITPVPFAWDDRLGRVEHHEAIRHTCRNFENIRTWAIENAMDEDMWWGDFPRPQTEPMV